MYIKICKQVKKSLTRHNDYCLTSYTFLDIACIKSDRVETVYVKFGVSRHGFTIYLNVVVAFFYKTTRRSEKKTKHVARTTDKEIDDEQFY